MTRAKAFGIIGIGLYTGFISGLILGSYEILKYIIGSPALFSGTSNLIYLIGTLILIPSVSFFKIRDSDLGVSYFEYFSILFVGYLLCSSLVALMLIFIHHSIDPEYRERIADFHVANIMESNRKLEQKIGGRIATTDFNNIRNKELERYSIRSLMKTPLYFLPVGLLASLIFSYALTLVGRRQSPDGE